MENDTNIGTVYLPMREAAARANLSYGHLLRLCSTGRGPAPDATMPGGRGGKRLLFREETVNKWMAGRLKGSWRNTVHEEAPHSVQRAIE